VGKFRISKNEIPKFQLVTVISSRRSRRRLAPVILRHSFHCLGGGDSRIDRHSCGPRNITHLHRLRSIIPLPPAFNTQLPTIHHTECTETVNMSL